MVAVGAVLIGSMSSVIDSDDGPARSLLATELVEAGARCDSRAIQDLIEAHCGGTGPDVEVLLAVFVELMSRFAVGLGTGS